jgi:acetolactate synthase-1/2/3 large subunit
MPLMYTASSALLEAMLETGIDYLFANLGSDHTALIEAIAQARSAGMRAPQVITCPHEQVALSVDFLRHIPRDTGRRGQRQP